MHPALLKLVIMQTKAWVRRQFRGGSVRRTVFAIIGTVMMALWLGFVFFGPSSRQPMTPNDVLTFLPIYITVFMLLPIVFGTDDRAIAFTAAEVDTLFAGPFTRRDVVLYKMAKVVLG